MLPRALVRWFSQPRRPTLSASDASSDAASDDHASASHQQAQSTTFSSLFPGVLPSQSRSRSRSPRSRSHSSAATSPFEFLTRPPLPAATPFSFTPAQLASLSSRLPCMPPSQRAVRDAGPAAAVSSVESDRHVRVEPAASDWQMFQAERRHVSLNAIPSPLSTFESVQRCVFHTDFIIYIQWMIMFCAKTIDAVTNQKIVVTVFSRTLLRYVRLMA